MSVPEKQTGARDRLWWLVWSPVVWTVHFLACYITAAVFCAKFADGSEEAYPVRVAVAVYTLIALGLIALIGWLSFRRHMMGDAALPHDFDSEDDQKRFLGFSAFLLSLLSGVATVFTAMVFFFMDTCH